METKDLELKKIIDKYDHIGMNILHCNKDEVDFVMCDGYQDKESNTVITPDTIFRIASVSKIEVALSAMKLYEEGKLDLYDDISKYLGYKVRNPYFPDDIITIEMLMTQTSSIHDGDDDPHLGYDGVNGPDMFVSLERLLMDPSYEYYTDKTWGKKAPGTDWMYSNFGCGILACIVEKVSGKLFTDYVKEVVLDPLGIDGGYRVDQVKAQDKVSSLYEFENGEFYRCRNLELFTKYLFTKWPLGNNFRGPAGGLFISVMGLSKIARMFINNGTFEGKEIFKETTIKEMKKVHWRGVAPDPQYHAKGLQLVVLDGYSKESLLGHFGYAYNLRSFMLFNSTDAYVFACNGADYHNVAEHMTECQKEILCYLIKKFER